MDSNCFLTLISVILFVLFFSSCCVNGNDSNILHNENEYFLSIENLSLNGISIFDKTDLFKSHLLKIHEEEFHNYVDDSSESYSEWCEYYDFGMQRVFFDEERTQFRFVYFQLSKCKWADTKYIVKFPGTLSYEINEKSSLQYLKDVFKEKKFVDENYCEYDSRNNLTGYVLHLNINDKFYYLRFNLTENGTVDSLVIYKDV